MNTASIVVDMRHIRCSNCKVALHDELITECPVCGAKFDSITSNHVGLAERLGKKREAAGVRQCSTRCDDPVYGSASPNRSARLRR